jgi:hypothetical protein
MTAKQRLPNFLERVPKCHYCGREMAYSSLSYMENPFCDSCLAERLGLNQVFPGEVRWREVGHYMELITSAPQKPS